MNTVACRACGAPIIFLKKPRADGTVGVHPTDAATVTPGDETYDGVKHVSHFDTCPEAWRFRRQPAAKPAAPVAAAAAHPAPKRSSTPTQLDLFGASTTATYRPD